MPSNDYVISIRYNDCYWNEFRWNGNLVYILNEEIDVEVDLEGSYGELR
jgi:hypothetical protein